MKYPVTYQPKGYYSVTISEQANPTCYLCEMPATLLVETYSSSGMETYACCALHADAYLPSTDLDGEQGEIATIDSWGVATPVRVVLAEFEPGDRRWTCQRIYGGERWETTSTGWYRTREAAILSWIGLNRDKVIHAAPGVEALVKEHQARMEQRRIAAEAEQAAELLARQEESRRWQEFWGGVNARTKAMKGKRQTITLRTREGEAIRDVTATVYGPLAVYRTELAFRPYQITHIPTSILMFAYKTLWDARVATCLLLDCGVAWEAITSPDQITREHAKLARELNQAVQKGEVPTHLTLIEIQEAAA